LNKRVRTNIKNENDFDIECARTFTHGCTKKTKRNLESTVTGDIEECCRKNPELLHGKLWSRKGETPGEGKFVDCPLRGIPNLRARGSQDPEMNSAKKKNLKQKEEKEGRGEEEG